MTTLEEFDFPDDLLAEVDELIEQHYTSTAPQNNTNVNQSNSYNNNNSGHSSFLGHRKSNFSYQQGVQHQTSPKNKGINVANIRGFKNNFVLGRKVSQKKKTSPQAKTSPRPTNNINNNNNNNNVDEGSKKYKKFTPKGKNTVSNPIFNFPNPELDSAPVYDPDTIHNYVYPTNYPERQYQFSIVKRALFYNTLVCLPTGLGKTFIAAVVMFNYKRWFPFGKVIFMAPTKPLVAQQIQACHHITGIAEEDTVEMTGHMQPEQRSRKWREKQVFFVTPQVLVNDIKSGTCPANSIVCIVVDEAHRFTELSMQWVNGYPRAQGNYAYCTAIQEIASATRHFRVLALSATPGADVHSIQNVINNLMISHMEIRTDEDADVRLYTNETVVETITVPLSAHMIQIRNLSLQILQGPVDKLCNMRVFYQRDASKCSSWMFIKQRESIRDNRPLTLDDSQMQAVESNFALAISLFHAWGLLSSHGLASYKSAIDKLYMNAAQGSNNNKKRFFLQNQEFRELRTLLEQFTDKGNNHPKLEKVVGLLLEHFQESGDDGDTRAMVFVQYRESVTEIVELLGRYSPVIKAVPFVGHASQKGSKGKGLTQKEQTDVINKFRSGFYNTLVATCIGEEGLDIGEVDLIICFDAQSSPTRLVQRMGRTGRRRKGRCVLLLTEGVEEQVYKRSQSTKKSVFNTISVKQETAFNFYDGPRVLPEDVQPEVLRMELTIGSFQETEGKRTRRVKASSNEFLSAQDYSYYCQHFKLGEFEPRVHLNKEKWIGNQIIATPVGQIGHTFRTSVLINTMQWLQENADSEIHEEVQPSPSKRPRLEENVNVKASQGTKPSRISPISYDEPLELNSDEDVLAPWQQQKSQDELTVNAPPLANTQMESANTEEDHASNQESKNVQRQSILSTTNNSATRSITKGMTSKQDINNNNNMERPAAKTPPKDEFTESHIDNSFQNFEANLQAESTATRKKLAAFRFKGKHNPTPQINSILHRTPMVESRWSITVENEDMEPELQESEEDRKMKEMFPLYGFESEDEDQVRDDQLDEGEPVIPPPPTASKSTPSRNTIEPTSSPQPLVRSPPQQRQPTWQQQPSPHVQAQPQHQTKLEQPLTRLSQPQQLRQHQALVNTPPQPQHESKTKLQPRPLPPQQQHQQPQQPQQSILYNTPQQLQKQAQLPTQSQQLQQQPQSRATQQYQPKQQPQQHVSHQPQVQSQNPSPKESQQIQPKALQQVPPLTKPFSQRIQPPQTQTQQPQAVKQTPASSNFQKFGPSVPLQNKNLQPNTHNFPIKQEPTTLHKVSFQIPQPKSDPQQNVSKQIRSPEQPVHKPVAPVISNNFQFKKSPQPNLVADKTNGIVQTQTNTQVSNSNPSPYFQKNDQQLQQPDQQAAQSPSPRKGNKYYYDFLNRPPPPNKGKKILPVGQPNCLGGKNFLITGVLDSLDREDAVKLIQNFGGNVMSTLSKKLDYAVVGIEPGPKKMEKLKELSNVQIINEDELFQLISSSPTSHVQPTPKRPKKSSKAEFEQHDQQIELHQEIVSPKANMEGRNKLSIKAKLNFSVGSHPLNEVTVDAQLEPEITPIKSEYFNSLALLTKVTDGFKCPICNEMFDTEQAVGVHLDEAHSDAAENENEVSFELEETHNARPLKRLRKLGEQAASKSSNLADQKKELDLFEDFLSSEEEVPLSKYLSKSNKQSNPFIDDEAVVSGDDGDEDDEDEMYDEELDSPGQATQQFLTTETPKEAVSPRSMMAVYRRSLLSQTSPMGFKTKSNSLRARLNKFKMVYDKTTPTSSPTDPTSSSDGTASSPASFDSSSASSPGKSPMKKGNVYKKLDFGSPLKSSSPRQSAPQGPPNAPKGPKKIGNAISIKKKTDTQRVQFSHSVPQFGLGFSGMDDDLPDDDDNNNNNN